MTKRKSWGNYEFLVDQRALYRVIAQLIEFNCTEIKIEADYDPATVTASHLLPEEVEAIIGDYVSAKVVQA